VTRNSPIEEVTETGHEKADGAHKERPSQPDEQGRRKRKKKPKKSEHIRADDPFSEQYPINPQYSRIEGMAYFRAYQWLSLTTAYLYLSPLMNSSTMPLPGLSAPSTS
jgi:hypothetical protein